MRITIKNSEKRDHDGFYLQLVQVMASFAEMAGLMIVHDGTALDKEKDLELRFVTKAEFPDTLDGKRLAAEEAAAKQAVIE